MRVKKFSCTMHNGSKNMRSRKICMCTRKSESTVARQSSKMCAHKRIGQADNAVHGRKVRAFNLKCNLLICAGTEKRTKDTLHFDEGQFSSMGIIRIGMISSVGLF